MNLKEVQYRFHKELDALYDKEEVDSFFFLLTEAYFKVTRLKLAMEPQLTINNYDPILAALDSLKQQQPIQYILGETDFFGLSFKVNENTLIPRPETEELVAWIISEFRNQKTELKILDIGTGSGCIAISLAKKIPNAKVYALDVSAEALKIAKQNADSNDVKVSFFQANILEIQNLQTIINNLNFDIIVSNPPYVRELEKELMKPNVLDNEPHLALFVDDNNPLIFYKAIAQFAVNKLIEKGMLFFEINEYLGEDMIQLLEANQFKDIELKKDFFKKDRMIKGVKIND
ncbi:peptide chain release factor N(5)-glutamine methyltransferase [Mariniflexile sp.]|uniref:peptide chain release factor N(5)-glutamine methyltransferase n=1 Tax=Mariniflexile sp. TaxID=1979402 RepID=UPI003561D035